MLDTNIVIALFANEAAVQQRLTAAQEVFVPCIVLGELYYGAYRSARVVENLARLDDFATSNTVLLCDTVTARHYGDIKNTLRAKGRPFPKTISGLPRSPGNMTSLSSHVMRIFMKSTACRSKNGKNRADNHGAAAVARIIAQGKGYVCH